MTIDKQKLKAAALAIDEGNALEGPDADDAMIAFEDVATPSAILALLAEIERLEAQVRLAGVAAEVTVHQEVGRAVTRELALAQERDQLNAENEALRKDAERYQWLKSNTTVMFRKTPSYVNTHGVLMHTCYPPEQELDAAIDWGIAKGVSRG